MVALFICKEKLKEAHVGRQSNVYGTYEKSRTIEVAAKKKKSEKPQIQASLKLLLILAA